MSDEPKSIDDLSDEEFVTGWKALTGEPPAALLEDRSEMIQMLLDGCAAAAPECRPAGTSSAAEPVGLDHGGALPSGPDSLGRRALAADGDLPRLRPGLG